jgi:fimbrial chaperone protein
MMSRIPTRSDCPRSFVRRGLLFGLACAIGSMAYAGTFQLMPVYGEAKPDESVLTYTLTNHGGEPITLQADARRWEQDAGTGDREESTGDLVIVPRIVSIPPGESRALRVALRDRARRSERAFRFIVQEVPRPPPAGFVGMQAVVAQNVPLVFTVAGQPRSLEWRPHLQADGSIRLVASNPGPRFVRVVDIRLVDARGALLARREGGAYVLAGKATSWPLTTHAVLSRGDVVRLRFEQGGRQQEVPVTVY